MSSGGPAPRWPASHRLGRQPYSTTRRTTLHSSVAMSLAAAGIVAGLSLSACGANDDSALQDRVDELEQENSELRDRIDDLQSGATTTAPGAATPVTTGPVVTTSTPVSTTIVTPTTAAAILGTRENPIPLGEPVVSGDWTLTVVAFEPNVDAFVGVMDPNNDPPGDGKVYARLRLHAVYGGREGAGDPGRLQISLVAPSGTAIGSVEPCCEPARDSLTDQAATFPGGAVEGWTYYTVPATELFAGSFLAFDVRGDSDRTPDGLLFFRVT